MDKTKIIVVEDNIVYCEFVCNLLAREKFCTVQAFHLSTAKKLLQQAADNDIVVSDLRLPDGDGIDLLRWMRKEGMTQPFIIMTDYAEVHTAVESMKLGSLDYIPKQLVEDKLVPLLRTILKERNIGRSRMPVFARDGSAFRKIMHRIRLVGKVFPAPEPPHIRMFPLSFSRLKFSDIFTFWLRMRLKFSSLSASILFAI
ncbi:response regulator, partial [Bacteroides acidifaciens]|uniref:response regulator n=1 Tax=Bacteroides acidifaciens TaxID=85831 RepID=UPI0025A50357